MKYRNQKIKVANASETGDYYLYFYNTPLSCVLVDSDDSVVHPGLNLTDDGEWIPAPGFERPSTDPGSMGGI